MFVGCIDIGEESEIEVFRKHITRIDMITGVKMIRDHHTSMKIRIISNHNPVIARMMSIGKIKYISKTVFNYLGEEY